MSMSKFRKGNNQQSVENSLTKPKQSTDSSKNTLANSIQGIKFLNFPLINEGVGSACPNLKACATYKIINCSWNFRRKKEAVNVKNELLAENVIDETKKITDSSKSGVSSSVQGIKFLNIPLINEEINKYDVACPSLKVCLTNAPPPRKLGISINKADIKETNEINRTLPTRRP